MSAISESGILMNQRKYSLELISETGLLTSKPISNPIDVNIKLTSRQMMIILRRLRIQRMI